MAAGKADGGGEGTISLRFPMRSMRKEKVFIF
jgi:hypothetical protein